MNRIRIFITLAFVSFLVSFTRDGNWQSRFVQPDKNGTLKYVPDEQGNTIPDFSRVGYLAGDAPIPDVRVVKTISPSAHEDNSELIQSAIDAVSRMPLETNGFRGAILLKKGTYHLTKPLRITATGIVLRGEGSADNRTKLIADYRSREPLIMVTGTGEVKEVPNTRTRITDEMVPTGSFSFNVSNAKYFSKGDRIILYRPGTDAWIEDLQMNRIIERQGTKQWKAEEYHLRFERMITKIEGNRIFIDNPVVMPFEKKYGGAEVYKYAFEGRISKVGIENFAFESIYDSDTAENHSWVAVEMNKIENGWVRNVSARYFATSCVNLEGWAKNISVLNSSCTDHKSVITGGRRYSFNNNGQQNLFMNCHSEDGRHDYVTGARVCGPNVFAFCTANTTHSDIGPHHRWSVGTLYDNIITDGDINIQDRGNWGSGHGWAGTTQIVWNSTAKRAAVQNPWVSGKNYCIGLKGQKYSGRLTGKPDGEWEGLNEPGLQPPSLFIAQLKARNAKTYKGN